MLDTMSVSFHMGKRTTVAVENEVLSLFQDMTMMAPEWSPTCSGSTSSKQVFDRRPPPLQHVDATSRGRRGSTSYADYASPSHTQPAAVSATLTFPLANMFPF